MLCIPVDMRKDAGQRYNFQLFLFWVLISGNGWNVNKSLREKTYRFRSIGHEQRIRLLITVEDVAMVTDCLPWSRSTVFSACIQHVIFSGRILFKLGNCPNRFCAFNILLCFLLIIKLLCANCEKYRKYRKTKVAYNYTI